MKSKVFVLIALIPIMYIFTHFTVFAEDSDMIKLLLTDDTFVLSNLNNPHDLGKSSNFGYEDFLKVWYAWNSTSTNEKIVSLAFLKFDLSELDQAKEYSAQLKMYPYVLDTGDSATLAVFNVPDNEWNENDLTYSTSKSFNSEHLALTRISEPNQWYSWDITHHVMNSTGTEMSLMVMYPSLINGTEKNIAFYSKESPQDKAPFLEIQYGTAEQQAADSGGCLIATAAYGTELAPQIQQLRELRDSIILNTESGKSFMESFNSFYYSFSPVIADYERQNPAFKEMVKLGITPLVSSLSVLNHTEIDSEAEMIGYGSMVILLNGMMYVALPALAIINIKKVLH